jgi:hypothetical protein
MPPKKTRQYKKSYQRGGGHKFSNPRRLAAERNEEEWNVSYEKMTIILKKSIS